MLIPTTSAKLAWWHRMLAGNKRKGVQFLSNVMYIQPWALEAIDDGGLVTVAYDPRTPNRAELIAIIESAGYADRASAVITMLQIGLSGSSDWAGIANNAQTMEIIFGNANARQLVFTLPVAFTAIINSEVGRNALLSNNAAWTEMLGYNDLVDIALRTPAFITALAGNSSAANILLGHTAFNRIVTIENLISPVVNNSTLYSAILNTAPARTKLFSATLSATYIANQSSLWNIIMSDTTYRNALYNSGHAAGIFIANPDIRDAIIGNTTYVHEFIDNFYSSQAMMEQAKTAGSAGALMLGRIYDDAALRGRFMASSYFASLTATSGTGVSPNILYLENSTPVITSQRFLLMGFEFAVTAGANVNVSNISSAITVNPGGSLSVAGKNNTKVYSTKLGIWSLSGVRVASITGITNISSGDTNTYMWGEVRIFGFYF